MSTLKLFGIQNHCILKSDDIFKGPNNNTNTHTQVDILAQKQELFSPLQPVIPTTQFRKLRENSYNTLADKDTHRAKRISVLI